MLIGIDRIDLAANCLEECQRLASRAHENLRPKAQVEGERDIDGRLDRLVQTVVARVPDDSNDLQPAIAAGRGHAVKGFGL